MKTLTPASSADLLKCTGPSPTGEGNGVRALLLLVILALLSSCSPTVRSTATNIGNPDVVMPVPGPDESFDYRAISNNCNCREYKVTDRMGAEYVFRAEYRVDSAVVTTIIIEISNTSARDSLRLDPGVVKISSKNVNYQHSGQFLPLPDLRLGPGRSDKIELEGRDVQPGSGAWNKIAGEQLTVTMKGMRLGKQTLAPQTVTFIPDNPRMKK